VQVQAGVQVHMWQAGLCGCGVRDGKVQFRQPSELEPRFRFSSAELDFTLYGNDSGENGVSKPIFWFSSENFGSNQGSEPNSAIPMWCKFNSIFNNQESCAPSTMSHSVGMQLFVHLNSKNKRTCSKVSATLIYF